LDQKQDGGYLLPDGFNGISTCFSPGVGGISDFESDCANLGINVYMADKSVDCPAVQHTRFNFLAKYLASVNNSDCVTLNSWADSTNINKNEDLILQMDIEGSEYEVILSITPELISRFRIIIVEFHFLDQLFNKDFFDLASKVFEKLLLTHSCVHNHPNNVTGSIKVKDVEIYPISELTFVRNDHVYMDKYCNTYPHLLDRCSVSKKEAVLPKCWYKQK